MTARRHVHRARSLVTRIRNSSFVRNVVVLVSGTAVAQVLVVLAAPILSRLYSPTAFGVMSVVLAVSGPVAMMASLKYELAIVLVKEDKDASNLFILSGGLVLVTSLLTLLTMPFVGNWLAYEMDRPTAAPLMIWIPAIVLLRGVYGVVAFWANRRRDYFWTSTSTVGRSFGIAVVQIALGLVDKGAAGLIVGRVCGQIVAIIILSVHTLKNDWRLVLRSFDRKRMKELAREHDHFPKYNAPREGLVAFSGSIPSFFLALFFSPAAAGLYWFTVRLLDVPTALIGIAVRRVFFERAAKAFHAEEKIYPLLVQATIALAVLGLVPVLVILIEGPELFDIAFGEEWRGAGVYARWLTIWWVSSFCNAASSALIPVFRLQRLFLGIEMVGLVLRAGAIGAAVLFGDDVLAIALYSIVGFLLNVYRTVYVIQFAKHHQGNVSA